MPNFLAGILFDGTLTHRVHILEFIMNILVLNAIDIIFV